MELMKGDSLEVSNDTPKYNPQGLPFKKLRLNNKNILWNYIFKCLQKCVTRVKKINAALYCYV